jgi:Ankyrin repeats (3 copies)
MDALFTQAVALLEAGDAAALARLLDQHPHLLRERTDFGDEAYFQKPYLLWFVAENPVRNGRLPANIAAVTKLLIDRGADQVDYTLELVTSGRVPRESGVQRALIDVLCDAGADPGGAMLAALAHHELDAVQRLLERGAPMKLVVAVCLGHDGAEQLAAADAHERQLALTAAAFYGNARALEQLVRADIDVSAYSPKGFHPHATALHQAVFSGSLECVRLLVHAGARLDLPDRAYHATPLGWADYLEHPEIAAYLRSHESVD